MNKKLEQIKHFFSLIGFVLKTVWHVIRDKRTWYAVMLLIAFYLWGWFNANYFINDVKDWHVVEQRYRTVKKQAKNDAVAVKVVAQTVKAPIVPLTEEEIVKGAKYGDELWNIYMLESTRGKNDGCRKSGQFGGFGVMSLGTPACYESFEKAVERASYWYDKIRKENDLATTLCIWNLGTKVNNCMYYQKYLSL